MIRSDDDAAHGSTPKGTDSTEGLTGLTQIAGAVFSVLVAYQNGTTTEVE
jgi:hypothetical protein